MTSINKDAPPLIISHKKPYLLPSTDWKSLALLGGVALNATHAIFHCIGATQCTRNIYETGPCDEHLADTVFHFFHSLVSIYCIQRRKGNTSMKMLCILPVANSLLHLSQILFTNLMMDVEGFHDNDGFRKHTSQLHLFSHGFAGSLGVWWFVESLELCIAWGTFFGMLAIPLVNYSCARQATVAIVFIDALMYVFFSGERETVIQSTKYWYNRLTTAADTVKAKQY